VLAPELAAGNSRDADYAFDAIEGAEARHFWFESRRRLVLWALARHCRPARALLEVGCGTGFLLEGVSRAFPEAAVVGADPLLAFLARARERLPGATLLQMDARRIPFRDEFDAVIALDVIEHIDEDEEALREMGQALRSGGRLILTVPQHAWLWSEVDEWSRHRRRYSRRDLLARLRRAGLSPERVTSFSSLVLPLLLLSRKRPRRGPFDPTAELRTSPALNALLRGPAAMERGLIRAGVSFPAGGSLLVVARRP
jgi:SAM-dependent methyltransferase